MTNTKYLYSHRFKTLRSVTHACRNVVIRVAEWSKLRYGMSGCKHNNACFWVIYW